jgi:hypothetical protein
VLVLLQAGTNLGAVNPKPIDLSGAGAGAGAGASGAQPKPAKPVQTTPATPTTPTSVPSTSTSTPKNASSGSVTSKPVPVPVPGPSDRFMIVSFVNGIYHSEAEVKEIAEEIEKIFQSDVRSFYNPSSGSWIQDATKAGFELVLRPADLALSKQLAEHLRNTLSQLHPKGRVLHIAHSGGAILTYLAAKHHLSYSEANRIGTYLPTSLPPYLPPSLPPSLPNPSPQSVYSTDIVTLGGGRSLTHKYFKGRISNYYR